jgi:hypothetical protein
MVCARTRMIVGCADAMAGTSLTGFNQILAYRTRKKKNREKKLNRVCSWDQLSFKASWL